MHEHDLIPMNGVEFFAGMPPEGSTHVSVKVAGKELCVAGDPGLADFLNDAFLKREVQVFGFTMKEEGADFINA